MAWSDSLPTLYSSRWSPPLVPIEDRTESGELVCASRLWDNTDGLVERAAEARGEGGKGQRP
jgi:hypothetical protein